MTKKRRARSTAAKEVNKSAAIRDILEHDPDGKPQAIAQQLADQGVDVSAAFVSQVKLKMKQREQPNATVPTATEAATKNSGQFAGDDLLEAKRLIDKLGVEKARAAVDLLAKLA